MGKRATVDAMTRRQTFAAVIPKVVRSERGGEPVSIADIYAAIERDFPVLADGEIESSTGVLRWRHELRWEIETAVVKGKIQRRKDLGRGFYSM
ncbi:hypothetical protein GCM10027058_29330 [Microbacterium neimengense]